MSIATKNPPKGWPRIASSPVYSEAGKAIDWLCKAFGFEIRIKVDGEGGRVEHSELTLGGGMIMVGDVDRGRTWRRSPKQLDGLNTQTMMVFVDDADAHCEHARAAGAKIETEPKTTDYGDDFSSDRGYEAVDLEGHHWWFIQRMRDEKPKA